MIKPLSKRETELHVFRKFCQILNSFEPEEFDSPDDPDFLKKDCSLAIELVEYHRDQHDLARAGSSKRMTEEVWLKLLSESKKEFEKQSQARMDVLLFPCSHPKVKPHFSGELARQIVYHLEDVWKYGDSEKRLRQSTEHQANHGNVDKSFRGGR